MPARLAAAALAPLLLSAAALAQQPPPIPLWPGAAPHSYQPEPLPPSVPALEGPRFPASGPMPGAGPTPGAGLSPPAGPMPGAAPPAVPENARIFCEQPVAVRIADPDRVPERYRGFVGMWSDASWTPQLCAALVVENVAPDGTATIVYAFGPMGPSRGPSGRGPAGGVLNGTGIVRDGELRFQNADGSQFAFRPFYADLEGRLTTPQGQAYQSLFKKQF